MKADKTLEIKSSIITIKQLKNQNIMLMDENGSLRCIQTQNYKTISGFKTNISQENSWGSHMSVSASGLYAACIKPHTNEALVYDVSTKKLLYTTSEHKGDIECVCVDDTNHYLVTGGTDGRTFVHNLETSKLVYSFPPCADYISTLALSHIWIASASYDKSISILNLTTMKPPTRLIGHNAVVIGMQFLKSTNLLSADKAGNLLLWDLKRAKLLQRLPKLNDDITCLEVSGDKHFAFVGTKLGYVSLYSLETNTLLKRMFIKESEKITALCVLDKQNKIVVGTKSGRLHFYSLIPDETLLIEKLKNKDYVDLYKDAQDNPLLHYSSVFSKLEVLWQNTFNKATKMLELNQRENAEILLEPFSKVKQKKLLSKIYCLIIKSLISLKFM